jgi:hypothetical protein
MVSPFPAKIMRGGGKCIKATNAQKLRLQVAAHRRSVNTLDRVKKKIRKSILLLKKD